MKPQVALSKEFMESYSRLPRKVQKKVREFTEKFQQDPTSSGINFERLTIARDEKVRSVRIDQAYRAIVVHPPKGDVFLCVWVDLHDDAYDWVRNKKFEVNPSSGSFQLYELRPGEANVDSESPSAEANGAGGAASVVDTAMLPGDAPQDSAGLFSAFDDEALLLAGVPGPLLASVRAVGNEPELDALAPLIPADASEMLYLLAAGYSLTDAMAEAERSEVTPGSVDVEDFGKALALPASQQSFRIIESDRELEEMLDAPLEKWRIFLHPTQRKLVKMNANGPVRVLGGAGTGKTVVLMHRASHLASNIFTAADDRILVTTYTRNLAADLEANLRNLCSEEVFARLEVVNLHAWVDRFMRKQGQTPHVVSERRSREMMEAAVAEQGTGDLPVAFYSEEWNEVVQEQDVDSRDAYLTARRVGRGTRLGRKQRVEVWAVLERYREMLNQEGLSEWPDLIREARLFIEKQGMRLPYRSVLADEVQDFTANELKLLAAVAPSDPNNLFLVGDGHQRIYKKPARLSACGIEIRGRSRRLRLNYRTTEQIRDRAVAVLEGLSVDDLDGGTDSMKGYRSLRHGPFPLLEHFEREADEARFILERVKAWLESVPGEAICVAARTNDQLDARYETVLRNAGIETIRVKSDADPEHAAGKVRLATMHRMKGLEFSRVLLVGVQDGYMPPAVVNEKSADDTSRAENIARERCLLYVAATRARDELAVTGFGSPSPLLAG